MENRKHAQINKVKVSWIDRPSIPKAIDGMKHLYAVILSDGSIGVGESSNIFNRINSGYAWKIRTMKPDGSRVIEQMQNIAVENGNALEFEVMCLDQVPAKEARKEESVWIERFKANGFNVLNKTRPVK
jgi:hypothetical protein